MKIARIMLHEILETRVSRKVRFKFQVFVLCYILLCQIKFSSFYIILYYLKESLH